MNRLSGYFRRVAIDAVTKCNHFRKCGRATKAILPLIFRHFDAAEAEIRELEADGRLNLHDYVDSAMTPDQWDDIRACTADLHCARPEASSSSGPCDVHGVVGGVCPHGFPLLGLFIDMHGPEQFVYYLVFLKWLVKACAESGLSIQDVYVDFGCKLDKTWQRHLQKNGDAHFASDPEKAIALGLRLLVNWMHGSSHELSCQILKNGRYTTGAGHMDGEGVERLWAETKVSCYQYTAMLLHA